MAYHVSSCGCVVAGDINRETLVGLPIPQLQLFPFFLGLQQSLFDVPCIFDSFGARQVFKHCLISLNDKFKRTDQSQKTFLFWNSYNYQSLTAAGTRWFCLRSTCRRCAQCFCSTVCSHTTWVFTVFPLFWQSFCPEVSISKIKKKPNKVSFLA